MAGAATKVQEKPVSTFTGPKTRVLVVDDSTAARFKVRSMLEALHCDVSECSDGEEGIGVALLADPEFIVLDISMPGMTGIEILESLRDYTSFRDTPIVMLTGSGDVNDVARSIQLKATDYIRKNQDVEALTERLRAHLKKLRGF